MTRYLLDTMITNNATGRTTRKAFTVEASDKYAAINKADDYRRGAESMIIIRAHKVSDFSNPMGL